ncbi:MAG: LptF/LptG family permease [Longimicrobiales bacterium]
MIRILDRLVARSFLKVFFAFILGSPVLFILGDVTENLQDYLGQGLTLAEVGKAYLYKLPQFIQWSFPIAALVSSVFTVQTMTLHKEIVAAKAGGISFHRVILPLLVLGVILTFVALGLEEVVPRANQRAAEILRQESIQRVWRTNFVYQAEDGRNFSVQRLNADDGTLTGVVMETIEPGASRPTSHLTAESARYEPDTGWTFHEGFYRIFLEDGSQVASQFRTFQVRGFTEKPEDLLDEPRKPEEMTREEMGRLADIVERSGGEPHKLRVDREEKIALPVATLVIILFGAPMATSTKRGGTAFGIGVALLSTILYMLLFRISGAVGETGALDPFTAAWLPNYIFLAAGIFFLARVRT